MRDIFNNQDTEAVILVDAINAFNTLNLQVALHNLQRTCPAFATILINTYKNSSHLAVASGAEIKSQEGSTQGDNLGGHLYNQGTIPLQTLLHITTPTGQLGLAHRRCNRRRHPIQTQRVVGLHCQRGQQVWLFCQ